jgi:hypothetical protein
MPILAMGSMMEQVHGEARCLPARHAGRVLPDARSIWAIKSMRQSRLAMLAGILCKVQMVSLVASFMTSSLRVTP